MTMGSVEAEFDFFVPPKNCDAKLANGRFGASATRPGLSDDVLLSGENFVNAVDTDPVFDM
jgi:hypothetical protein